MSDKPIGVGDLVVVVRACEYCGNNTHLGYVFCVRWVGYSDGSMDCCENGYGDAEWSADDEASGDGAWPTSWLKRLDPDALRNDTPTKEELTA